MSAEADTHVQNLKQHGYVVFQLMTANEIQAAKKHVESKCPNSSSTSRVSNPVLGTSAVASFFGHSQHRCNDMQISKEQEWDPGTTFSTALLSSYQLAASSWHN